MEEKSYINKSRSVVRGLKSEEIKNIAEKPRRCVYVVSAKVQRRWRWRHNRNIGDTRTEILMNVRDRNKYALELRRQVKAITPKSSGESGHKRSGKPINKSGNLTHKPKNTPKTTLKSSKNSGKNTKKSSKTPKNKGK
jgi:hypothetical protein